jgi:hypothetical protein
MRVREKKKCGPTKERKLFHSQNSGIICSKKVQRKTFCSGKQKYSGQVFLVVVWGRRADLINSHNKGDNKSHEKDFTLC